ncbi:MAG: sigma factor [Cumulibacter sp.]
MDQDELRALVPRVIAILCRRGADFAAAEDAVQEALVEAVRTWTSQEPQDRKGWLITVAWRKFLDAARSDAARHRREERLDTDRQVDAEAPVVPDVDDTLHLYFLCAHPD